MSYSKLQKDRDKKAEALGEGAWMNKITKEWCAVEVTFYPKTKLWITENKKRREITIEELKNYYATLQL